MGGGEGEERMRLRRAREASRAMLRISRRSGRGKGRREKGREREERKKEKRMNEREKNEREKKE